LGGGAHCATRCKCRIKKRKTQKFSFLPPENFYIEKLTINMNKKKLIGIGIGILIIVIALLIMDSIHEFSGERLLKIFKSPVTGILVLITGILLMVLSSNKAVEHSAILASALGISPLMIGLVLVSLGTDLPERSLTQLSPHR